MELCVAKAHMCFILISRPRCLQTYDSTICVTDDREGTELFMLNGCTVMFIRRFNGRRFSSKVCYFLFLFVLSLLLFIRLRTYF